MPGTIIFKPIQANLLQDNDSFSKMDTYCCVILGNQEVKTKVCKSGGKQPRWSDTLIIKRGYEPYCALKVMCKEWLKSDSLVGTVEIDLQEIEGKGRINKWYKIFLDNEPVGEMFIESMFAADSSGSYKQTPYQQSYAQPASPYKDFGRHLYPQDIYSPAKEDPFSERKISQMPLSKIPGLDKVHQVTLPHISHHLTPEEYLKLHSRQNEWYQPTHKVVSDQPAPPSWAGYEANVVQRSPEKQENSIGSTAGDTPENQKGNLGASVQESPKILSYYPTLGGVRYEPDRQSINYKPVFERKAASPVQKKGKNILEKFDAAADENDATDARADNTQTLEADIHSLETNAV